MNRMLEFLFPPAPSRGQPKRALLASCAALLLLAAPGCKSKRQDPPTTLIQTGPAEELPELTDNEDLRLVRQTNRNTAQWTELNLQGRTTQAVALRLAIAGAVDKDFDVFERTARDAEMLVVRNMAVKCISFAKDRRADARDVLLDLMQEPNVTIQANAVLGIGVMADPDTDLTPVVAMVASGNAAVRTNAAWALKDLFIVIPTPRVLTPQYYTAIQRLASLLHDPSTVRGRRAAAWALAKVHHPETLDHLIGALEDDDGQVQMGGLHGLQLLKDQRGIDPILAYLDRGPTSSNASWAKTALISIVVSRGLADQASDLEPLGTNPRLWRQYIRDRRMR